MAEQTSRLAIIIDSTGAEKNASSLSSALHGLTEWGQKAAASAGKVTKATQEEKSALQDLLDRIDPVNAALNKLDKQQQELSRAKSKGLLDADSFEDYAAKIDDARNRVSGLTGENEKLQASFSQIRSQLDPLGAALEKLKGQRATLSAARDAGLLSPEYHAELSNKLDLTEKGLNQVSNEMRYGAISAGQYKNAMRLLPAQLNDIAVGLAGGMPLFTIFMQQGSQIADSFGGWGNLFEIIKQQLLGAGDAADESSDSLSDNANSLSENAENAKKLTGFLSPMTIGIGALVAVVGTLTYAWYKGSQEQQEFNKSLVLTGNVVGKTTGQLADMAKAVADSTGNPTAVAAQALNRVVSGGKIAADSMQSVTESVVAMNDATGESIDSMVADFEKIAQNPVTAIGELNDKYHFLTLATYNQIKALQDEGNQQEAARLATETYAATMKQRADQIQGNLGSLEQAWKWLGDAAKGAWDAMLDIGREKSIDQKIAEAQDELGRAQKSLSDLSAGQSKYAGPYGAWKSSDLSMLQKAVDAAKARLASLQSEKMAQDAINQSYDPYLKKQQESIKLQQDADRSGQQYLTNSDRRAKAIQQETKFLEAGAITAEEYAKRLSRINEMYKDPEPPKARKGKAYTEDAGTRLLDQLNQQYATLQEQYTATEKIGSSQQALIKWEQQLSDIKGKKTLTAEQKSLLASQDAITAQLQKNAALEKEIAIRKDAEKLTAYQGNLSSGLRNDATDLQNSLNSNTVMSEEQKRQQEISKIVSSYQDKQAELTNQRTTGQISGDLYQQETQALQNALNQRLAMQQSYYAQVDQLNGNWQAGVMNGMQSYLNSVPTLYEASTSAVTSVLSATESAISSNFSAMLEGTESLSEGFQGIAVGMGQAVIDALTKMAAQWLVYEAVQLLVGKTTAASSVSALTGNAIAMSAMAQLNAYASTAAIPIVGPELAPAAMAAAAAISTPLVATVTAASASSLAGFQTGGYTGNGGVSEIAGVVHGKEYVFDAAATKRIGLSNLEALRNGGSLDATLSKPGFGTGNKNVSSSGGSSQTNHISQVINMPQSPGMTQQEMDAVLKLNNKQLVNELSNQTLEGKGQFGKSLRAAQGRGNRMT